MDIYLLIMQLGHTKLYASKKDYLVTYIQIINSNGIPINRSLFGERERKIHPRFVKFRGIMKKYWPSQLAKKVGF